MLIFASLLLLVAVASFFNGALGAAVARITARDGTPGLNYDPSALNYCTWWVDVSISMSCDAMLAGNALTLAQFRILNPSIPEKCDVLAPGNSYCVEAVNGVPSRSSGLPTSTTTRTSASSAMSKTTTSSGASKTSTTSSGASKTTTTSSGVPKTTASSTTRLTTTLQPSTTRPANGIDTPQPTQAGMVSNCNKFHWVEDDENCSAILELYSITLAQFAQWNPAAKSTCSGLWSRTWACVGVIGGTSAQPSPTKGSNGIATPVPTHPGIVSNCNKFVMVNPGDTCDVVAFFNGPIPTEDFVKWNAGVGGRECRGLQPGTYACIGIIGGTPTKSGNGIATPSPPQPGMVSNCNKFTKVNPNDTCDIVAFFNGISTEDFIKWNTGVGGHDCRGLQLGAYVCIGVM